MTTEEAVSHGIPRWMMLSHLVDDVAQILALVALEYNTPAQGSSLRLRYYLRCLRRDQWERRPTKRVPRPPALRPSKKSFGYRTSRDAHRSTRLQMEPHQRAEIAREGARARWSK